MKMKVFVYGSLKAGYWNHPVMQRAGGKFLTNAELPNAALYAVSSYPALHFEETSVPVKGEIYEVEDIKPLDWLEGYPSHYNRTEVETSQGKAWTYHYSNKPNAPKIESGEWGE